MTRMKINDGKKHEIKSPIDYNQIVITLILVDNYVITIVNVG